MSDPELFGRVAVLFGGWSSEREISLRSGDCVLAGLQKAGVDAFGLDLDEPAKAIHVLSEASFDRAFIMLHGKGGEDGTIQGILETRGIPYTGSGVLGASLTMDKLLTKRIWLSENLPTPRFIELHRGFDADYVAENLGLPLAVKPALEGSSIGISKVTSVGELPSAWEKAAQRGGKVFAERWIEGDEYTVAFVGDQIFSPIRVELQREFYDYRAKYKDDGTHLVFADDLSVACVARLQGLAWIAAELLDVRGWGRVDLLRDTGGKFWLLEVNTVPGMTDHSLVPTAAKHDNFDFERLTLEILATSGNQVRRVST